MLELALSEDTLLRLLEERDATELYRLIDANRDYLARWMPWAATQTFDGTLAFIGASRRQLGDNNGMQTAVVIGGRIAGVVGLHNINWVHETTSVGYWLGEEFQGRGAVTAAVRAYADHAFGPWALNRLELQAAVDNTRSCAVAERLGFTREGILRQADKVGDRVHDIALYAVLAAEWNRGKAAATSG